MWSNQKVLIISPESWNHVRVSKHHYAMELVAKGARVWFLNPSSNRWHLEQLNEQLEIVSYTHPRGLNHLPKRAGDLVSQRIIKRLKKFLNIRGWDIIWSFDPFRFQNLKLFDASRTIYFQADRHTSSRENLIIGSSDLALTISKSLSGETSERMISIGHGLDSKFVMVEERETRNERLKVGYVGNLNATGLDHELILRVINEFQNLEFHFAGPLFQNSNPENLLNKIDDFSNVFLHGELIEDLPEFLQSMDVLLLFYRKQGESYPSNSHKILEYLSSGKTILSMPILDYMNFPELIENAGTHDEFLSKLNTITENIELFNSAERRSNRKEFAMKHLYTTRLDQISKFLKERRYGIA